jgi:PKD repeat protein
VRRLIAACLLAVPIALALAGPATADPITVDTSQVKTGRIVTFTATTTGTDYSWDLDGDGVFGDKLGQSAKWAYQLPGPVRVGLRTSDATGSHDDVLPITVFGPSAAFVSFPASPLPGEPVTFAYSSREATQSIEWDLNSDSTFETAGATATRSFPAPGTYFVSVRVTDIDDPPATSTGTQAVTVRAPNPPTRAAAQPVRLISPFPLVRITGKVGRKGARIRRLSVTAPPGSTVSVRCRGKGCPFRRTSRTVAVAGSSPAVAKTITFPKLKRRLLWDGAIVKVLVSRPREIGKYTKFRIRKGHAPVRTDLCLQPGATVASRCPSS